VLAAAASTVGAAAVVMPLWSVLYSFCLCCSTVKDTDRLGNRTSVMGKKQAKSGSVVEKEDTEFRFTLCLCPIAGLDGS
jgi:hypothetical protein